MSTTSWKEGCEYDHDTVLVLDVSEYFLRRYFGHSESESNQAMCRFLSAHSDRFGEDGIHHYSSYLLAASVHYLCHLNGPPGHLGEWLQKSGHYQPPAEAREYFLDHYLSRSK